MSLHLEVQNQIYEAIAKEIHSDTSPVGIDAKKTHILILYKLEQLEQRLKRIEGKIEKDLKNDSNTKDKTI